MGIKTQYDKLEDIPEAFRELFAEKDGKMVLTGVEGMKTQADVDALSESLRKERNDHAQTKEGVKKFADVDLSKVKDMENELITLRAFKESGGQDEDAIKAIVEQRVANEVKALTEENDQYKTRVQDLEGYKFGNELNSTISEFTAEKFAKEHTSTVNYLLKNNSERQADGTYLTKEVKEFGLDAGMTIEQAVNRIAEKNTHFLPQNVAGGAQSSNGGGGQTGSNPFSKNSFNRTEQHKMMLENPSKAETLKAQAEKE